MLVHLQVPVIGSGPLTKCQSDQILQQAGVSEGKVQCKFRGSGRGGAAFGNVKATSFPHTGAPPAFQEHGAFCPSSSVTSWKIIFQTNAQTTDTELFIRSGYWCELRGRSNNVIVTNGVEGHGQERLNNSSRDFHPQESCAPSRGAWRSLLENRNNTWGISCSVLFNILFITFQQFL